MKRLSVLWLALLFIHAAGCHRPFLIEKAATEPIIWPPPPDIPRIKYIRSFSRASDLNIRKSWLKRLWGVLVGRAEEFMLTPYMVNVDSKGRIYITDTSTLSVHIFDPQRGYCRVSERSEGKPFLSPIGVATDSSGNLYVSDSSAGRVYIYNSDLRITLELGRNGELHRPAGIAINEKDNLLYVVDTQAHKILAFDLQGKFRFEFGKRGDGDGELNFPTHIFLSKDGLLYISDTLNFRIQVFDRNGSFVSKFGRLGDGSGDFSRPKGVAADSVGHIYVVDAMFDIVQIFDKEGKFLLAFGRTGRRPGEFWLPAGIFIDEHDKIYVADSYNERVQVFQFLKEYEREVEEYRE